MLGNRTLLRSGHVASTSDGIALTIDECCADVEPWI